ncbi:uncharacterized protein LOC125226819 isoform X1 [Leguminivora glycinivorella]|uniref:uncharacterized protein LOC125226819 isoform X1 n=1 Tax=Leguminivora glycinivorella TaxID=1035111 RepID=UPI00200CB4E9|nr:uncharacterized protein LOC125226819 isoform X1 [Leguminivora glycinivorella]XP_047986879.1 uncharacterized protein LOC125226819 isoform X1 [Leguminivora glycinivorella]XP_047986881.1 uncharacterized protein LOC125226819 isoform X1 [Leguminivora glycinivorella]
MPKCFLCFKICDCIKELFKHFSLMHGTHNFSLYPCVEDGCNRTFHLKNTYKKHITRDHINMQSDTCNASTDQISNIVIPCSSERHRPSNIANPHSNNYTLPMFLSSLYANPLIPKTAVQDVVDGMNMYLCDTLSSNLENIFREVTTSPEQDKKIMSLKQKVLSAVQSPIKSLDTEYKRLEYLKGEGTYIPPKEIVIGQTMCSVKKRGVVTYAPMECKEQLIPLRLVLQKYFSLDNVMAETLDYVNNLLLDNSLIRNIIQGSSWAKVKAKYKDRLVFPLFLFFDDYESGNVLGSHSGIHKLGAVYVSVGCIPPYRASTLTNIFLALLFHSSDRTTFGNNVIFHPLIEELNFLSELGVDIDVPCFHGKLYFSLALIIGDNLGIHSILGFNETFSSNHPCRICNVSKEELKTQCFENEQILRNAENYNEQLLKKCPASTGLKEKCVWLTVNDFSLFDNVGVDIMHDILEGVAKYVMSFLLIKYIRDLKYFSLHVLNSRINHFDYGPDAGSKPCLLTMEHILKGNIRLSASEMLTFLRYFGLLIGDFVPTDDCYWIIYITLRKILDLIMSYKIDKGTCDLLKVLISELNELYISLSGEKLKPKFHFMVHYPSMLLKFGPLVNFWSMRYEAKHRVSKIAARASFNRRNITLTLANKHQLQLNNMFLKGTLDALFSVGPSKQITVQKRKEVILQLHFNENISLSSVKWVKVKGTHYTPGAILVQNVGDLGDFTFAMIKNIFIYNNDRIIFECVLVTTIDFDFHLHCFEVEIPETESNIFVFQDSLLSYIPNHINLASNGKRYVTQRGHL